ncbi:MAG: nitroreductase/quinone reductase family protein [bacterium]
MTTPTTPTTAQRPAKPAPALTPELADGIRRALGHGHTIDITTTGRRTGEERRIEITFHSFDGHVYISGMPNPNGTRAWLLNLRANPDFTFHMKQLVQADLPATAREITEDPERLAVLEKIARVWRRDVEPMRTFSPLIEVSIPGFAPVATTA